ncbi:MAG: hypothetical protein U0796_05275 [Gemmatales bacterium]
MFKHCSLTFKAGPRRVSHLRLLAEVTIPFSAVAVMYLAAYLMPRDQFHPLIALGIIYTSAGIYIVLTKYVLRRFRFRMTSSIALTPFQACWVTAYVFGWFLLISRLIR